MSPFLSPWEGGGKNNAIVFRSVGGGMKSVMGVPSQSSIVEEVTHHGVMRPSPVSGLHTGSTAPVAVPIPEASSHQG